MDVQKIYVAATRQNDGKTTTAIGLLESISDHLPRVRYMKPVGQQVKQIGDHQIDKDASLMQDVFHIGTHLYDMSPVAIPRGFTQEYILHGTVNPLKEKILSAYHRACQDADFMVLEGTGHAGVGSVLDLSNAAVAKLLDAPVIIVTCAGIGRPIDEVMLNKAVFDNHNVKVLGVIVNKVIPEKFDKINDMVRLGFQRKGIETFGVVPYYPLLSNPTLRQLQEDIQGELISGESGLENVVKKILVGAMPPHTALDYLVGDVLLITPGNRDDLILAALTCNLPGIKDDYNVQGIILTGGLWPNRTVLKLLKQTHTPAMIVNEDTFITAQKVHNLIIKIRPEDKEKINTVKKMVKQYVNVEAILERLKEDLPSSGGEPA